MKNFESVSQMKSAKLNAGQLVETKQYYASPVNTGDGAARYKVLTAAEFGGTPDEWGDHTLANGNIAMLQIQEVINVKLYGAKSDGINNDQPSIQAAINKGAAGQRQVYFPQPNPEYRIDSPIVISTFSRLVGENNLCYISKFGNTTSGLPVRVAPGRVAVNDVMDVDAVIILDHLDDAYATFWSLENICPRSAAANVTAVQYSVYMPRANNFTIKTMTAQRSDLGLFWYDAFQASLSDIVFSSMDTGFRGADDGAGINSGTSLVFSRCYTNDCDRGYRFFALKYSTFISPACDRPSVRGYEFVDCDGISIIGAGIEATPASADYCMLIDGSKVTINGLVDNDNDPNTAKFAMINGSRVVANDMAWGSYPTPGVAAQLILQDTSHLVTHNSFFPPNGTTFISFSAGSTWMNTTDGVETYRNANNTVVQGPSTFAQGQASSHPAGSNINSGLGRAPAYVRINQTVTTADAPPTVRCEATQIDGAGNFKVRYYDIITGTQSFSSFDIDWVAY